MIGEDDQTSGPRSFELRAGLAVLLLIPLLLAALAFWFSTEYRRLGSTEDEARQAHARQLLISELFSSIKDAETGQRGFVITGNETFLEPYREGRRDVQEQLQALWSLPTTDKERRHLERFKQISDAKFGEMERVIGLRRSGGLGPAAASVSEGYGKALMDELRSEATKARAAEAQRLAQTLARQNERTRATEQISWFIVAMVALTFIGIGVLYWRSEHRRAGFERAAREAAARRRAIFDSTLDAIILINPSGSIETINRSASQLFGYAEDELIRRDISLIVDLAPGEGLFLDRIGLTDKGLIEPFRHNLTARGANGTTIPVEAALGIMPLPDGVHIVAALRDISEREKVEQIKDQFLSTVSHELRTPLTSIVGSLGLLRGSLGQEFPAAMLRLVVIAENNANRLIRLVNDLLDIEKLEAGEMSFDFQPIDLRDVGARALDAVRGMAENQQVELISDFAKEPVMIRGDAERLIQVFNNLLANAIRFTPAERTVSLQIIRRNGHAEASVIDSGPGIDAELRNRLFTRFAQSIQSPAGQARGTGLGLAISREIVRNHGGGIWYTPAPSGGSVFSFNLPLWNTVTGQPENGAAPRVLICAHESEARGIADALENRSIRADVVDTTEALMTAFSRQHYVALLLDYHYLGDNPRLLHEIHSDPTLRNLPVIAIAGGDEPGAQLASLDVIDWIPRPLDAARLNTAMASVIARARHSMPLILHVDDDTDTLEITAAALEGRARTARATDLASAREMIARDRPDVVIVDLGLPDGCGEQLLAELGGEAPIPVIIYSAQERNGAFANEVAAVLTKSRRSLFTLVETINEILDRQKQAAEISDGR
ncbi:CHASE3 domain-containing protein [Novosphingobium sp. PS1R-30]|uniref:histidine kinase n=1 Tax=Novosphingobium anseongense TaxID=3133436 RepID=A0ABU8RPX8_9SPHN|nr:MAG: PAS domain S-box protein [Novosphingobium sp.]